MKPFTLNKPPTPEILDAVLKFLFDKGYTYGSNIYGFKIKSLDDLQKKYANYRGFPYIYHVGNGILDCYSKKQRCLTYDCLSFEELFTLPNFEKNIQVELNKDYDAIVTEEGIIVGCQKFSFEKFDELSNAVKEFRK